MIYDCCQGCEKIKEADKPWCDCRRKDEEYERRFPGSAARVRERVALKLREVAKLPYRRLRRKSYCESEL